MTNKKIYFDNSGQDYILDGVKKLAYAVGSTLGPGGRNVILENNGYPLTTKDGVTVANNIYFSDRLENIGAQMIKQAAQKTCLDAGDGTTTATILSCAILEEGKKYLLNGINPIDVSRNITKAVSVILDYIEKNILIKDIKDDMLKHIAMVSSNWDDTLANIVYEAVKAVGKDGAINVIPSNDDKTWLKLEKGIKFNRGYISSYFVNNKEKSIVEMDNPYIMLYRGELKDISNIMPILQSVHKENSNLVIVADKFSDNVISNIIQNIPRGLKVSCMKAPWFKDMRVDTMNDLSIYLGTSYINGNSLTSDEMTLSTLSLSDLGRCEKFISSSDRSVFVGGKGDEENIKLKLKELNDNIKNNDAISDLTRENMKLRVKQLMGVMATINVGGATEIECSEKRDRIDDAIRAVQSAMEGGVVPGGSYALIKASNCTKLQKMMKKNDVSGMAAKIIEKAIKAPFKLMMKNAGEEEMTDIIMNKITKSNKKNYGYNIKSKKLENLVAAGVLDPYKVTKSALINSSSIANSILTSLAVITEDVIQ